MRPLVIGLVLVLTATNLCSLSEAAPPVAKSAKKDEVKHTAKKITHVVKAATEKMKAALKPKLSTVSALEQASNHSPLLSWQCEFMHELQERARDLAFLRKNDHDISKLGRARGEVIRIPRHKKPAQHAQHKAAQFKSKHTAESAEQIKKDAAKNKQFLKAHKNTKLKVPHRRKKGTTKLASHRSLESQAKENALFLKKHMKGLKAAKAMLYQKHEAEMRYRSKVESFDEQQRGHPKLSTIKVLSKQRTHNAKFMSTVGKHRPTKLSPNAKHVLHAIASKATRSKLSLLPSKKGHSENDELAEAKRLRRAANNDLLASTSDEAFRALRGFQ
jgi:hypothetical protein